jgi:hypothetical protein
VPVYVYRQGSVYPTSTYGLQKSPELRVIALPWEPRESRLILVHDAEAHVIRLLREANVAA